MYFRKNGIIKCPYDYALYIKAHKNGDILFVCLYVDDLIFTGNNPRLFEEFKADMAREFEMTDMGFMSYYLGLEVKQMKDGIFISQESYVKEMLKKFILNDCKPINTPIELGLKLFKYDDGEKVDHQLSRFLSEVSGT